jgi:UDP-galactopyranose mutase
VEVWNVGTGRGTTALEFVEAARKVTGVFIPICFGEAQQSHSPSKLVASAHKLETATGWKPEYTSIETILQTAWEYTKRHVELPDWRQTEYDVCIAGAGLSAAVLAERHVAEFNHSVLVMDKRNHIGGNCYDYIDKETGIRVSRYGVHLFHTKSERVWKYLQDFSKWTPWEHKCIAKVGDQHVPVPVNIDTVNALFGEKIKTEEEMMKWLKGVQIQPEEGVVKNSEDVALQRVGKKLYEMIFKPYTIKQWNKDPKELAPSVMARIPIRTNHDNRYFTDPFQALPTDGYTRIFENMFNSDRMVVKLNIDFLVERDRLHCKHTYFTGPIDVFFAAHGMPKLEYRSLEFERQVYRNTHFFQPRAHVNYPALTYNYTRAIEYKHILNQKSPHTVVFFERSTDVGEPYYPVPNDANQRLYAKYQDLAEKEKGLTFVGRLANYKYFNMDQTVLNALELFEKLWVSNKPAAIDIANPAGPRKRHVKNTVSTLTSTSRGKFTRLY